MTFYTDRFIPEGFAGWHFGPLIFIRPEYLGDVGLFAHERTHVRQFWRRPFTHMIRYRWQRSYRLACEVEAYRVQLAHNPQHAALYAGFIATRYGLKVSPARALAMLAHPWIKDSSPWPT